jgi:DNA-binding LytR/AlgR family response regulator
MKQLRITKQIPADQQIMLLESDNNYTIIHLENGQKIISSYCLSFHEKITDNHRFMRLNRSFMINKSFVDEFDLAKSEVLLNNGKRIGVSRRRMKNFEMWLWQ